MHMDSTRTCLCLCRQNIVRFDFNFTRILLFICDHGFGECSTVILFDDFFFFNVQWNFPEYFMRSIEFRQLMRTFHHFSSWIFKCKTMRIMMDLLFFDNYEIFVQFSRFILHCFFFCFIRFSSLFWHFCENSFSFFLMDFNVIDFKSIYFSQCFMCSFVQSIIINVHLTMH